MGSLFDGSGGFPLAGVLHGAVPVWASEIEPYPIAVTRSRFPNMKHLGSVTDINGGEVDPVDIITFGSPCQDMSVAGKRAGMQHSAKGDEDTTRSGLFYEAVRIIREMREKTNGEYPKFAIWENVPGAFTSNNGEDFLCVLEELFAICSEKELSIPRPKNGKWTTSGEIVGDRGSIAWRTLDAQYWGVPQRRKRIYLVADFDSDRAGKILFERDCLLGNSAQSREERQRTPGDAARSAGRGCIAFAWANSAGARLTASEEITPTIKAARCGEPAVTTENGNVECLNPWDAQTIRQYDANGIYPTLNSNSNGGQNRQGVCYLAENDAADHVKCLTPWDCQSKRQYAIDGAYRTLDAGQSCGGQAHGVVYPAAFMGGQGAKAGGIGYSEEVSPTLKSVMSGSNTTPDVVYALQGNGIDRKPENGCAGKGYRENEMYTLDVIDRHAVVYEPCSLMDESWQEADVKNALRANASRSSHAVVYDTTQITSPANYSNPKLDDPCHPLAARQHPPLAVVYGVDCRNGVLNENKTATLQAKSDGGYSLNCTHPVMYLAENKEVAEPNNVSCYVPASYAGYEEEKPTLRASGGDAGGGSEGIICCRQTTDIDPEKDPMLASGKPSTGTLLACASTKLWLGNQEAFTGDYTIVHNAHPPRKYIVRRLIPIECARLQGFPDCWGVPDYKPSLTEDEKQFWHEVRRVYAIANGKKYKPVKDNALLKWYNKLHTDSSEYKMWGNGIALPCAEYVVGGVVEAIAADQ